VLEGQNERERKRVDVHDKSMTAGGEENNNNRGESYNGRVQARKLEISVSTISVS